MLAVGRGLVGIVAHQPRLAGSAFYRQSRRITRGDKAKCEQKGWGRPVRSPIRRAFSEPEGRLSGSDSTDACAAGLIVRS